MSSLWMEKSYTLTGNDLLNLVRKAGKMAVGMPLAQFICAMQNNKETLYQTCVDIIGSLTSQGYCLQEAIEQCPPHFALDEYGGALVEITRSLLEFVAACDAQHIAQKYAWDTMTTEMRAVAFDNTLCYGWMQIVGEKNTE